MINTTLAPLLRDATSWREERAIREAYEAGHAEGRRSALAGKEGEE